MDYYEIASSLVEEWENNNEAFNEKDIPLLYCNGVFYKDRESLSSLGLITEEFPEDSKWRDPAQVETVRKFSEQLLTAWQTDGWLNTWKGIYLVFHQDGSSEISRTLLPMENCVKVSVGSYEIMGETKQLKDDRCSERSSAFQCFIEFPEASLPDKSQSV
jgi:hypothetical protein